MARLRPMGDDEYRDYVEILRETYIRDIVESGLMVRTDAEAKADADIETQLAEGVRTPGAYLYVVDHEGAPVGYAWMFAGPDQVGKPLAFVFDLWIHEDARGRGLGRAAMLALEEEARALGLDRIQLNVFGQNEPARRLYRSLGYAELSVLMGKVLSESRA